MNQAVSAQVIFKIVVFTLAGLKIRILNSLFAIVNQAIVHICKGDLLKVKSEIFNLSSAFQKHLQTIYIFHCLQLLLLSS